MKRGFRRWFLGVTTLAAFLALLAATYAWFSSNRAVETSLATTRTGDEKLELLISDSGGSSFKDSDNVAIRQMNQADRLDLMPVSTADLKTYVSAPVTISGKAKHFQKVTGEENYYHGRVYLKAVGEGWEAGSRMKLYLDESDGVLGKNGNGSLLNAARLGLKFNGPSSKTVILRLSEKENSKERQNYNTVVDGVTLGKNQVLALKNTNSKAASSDVSVKAVKDPSEPVKNYTVVLGDEKAEIPEKALLTMEFGKIYTVDIYFYLEGCDPDCSDAVSFNTSDLHLAFYGVLSQEAAR